MAEINIEKMAQNVGKKAIQELRDRGVFISRWIPVSERLPERHKEVIVTDIETSDTYLSRYIGMGIGNVTMDYSRIE